MTWIAQVIATDGLQLPQRAVKIEVFKEAEPDINYLNHLKAQAIGQYRVQYQEWAEGGNVLVRYREQHVDASWRSVYESVGGPHG